MRRLFFFLARGFFFGRVFVERVVIEKEECKGCELCVDACPRGVLVMSDEFNSSGYHYSVARNRDKCNSCTFCAVMCPDVCIEVNR